MKLIILDGGPASGKNTLGTLMINKIYSFGNKAILLDLDSYVEKINPKWIWDNELQKEKDQLEARANYSKEINKYLHDNFTVIAIGERFLTKVYLISFIRKLEITCPILLYHLSIPFNLRKQRLQQRGPHSLIDLEKDQNERDSVKHWFGYVYENINSPKEDAENLYELIQQEKGLLNLSDFK